MFGPHEGRAVTERAAQSLAVERFAVLKPAGEIGLSESTAADSDERGPAGGDVRCPGLERISLKPAISRADDGQRRDKRAEPRRSAGSAGRRRSAGVRASRTRRAVDTRMAAAGAGSRRGCPARRSPGGRRALSASPIEAIGSARSGTAGSSSPLPQTEVTGGGRAGDPAAVFAFGVRKTVEDIQPGGDQEPRTRVANAPDNLADESCSIVERAAIIARPRPRGQQLVEQIPMALLDVDEVKPDLMCECWRRRRIGPEAGRARRR